MNVLEKAEKSLEFLGNPDNSTKCHELQAAAGALGRCLGALGCRPNHTRHFANLLHSSIPILLALASNESAEVRLVGDEALNRAVVGGFAFHAHKANIVLMNNIDHTKNARWVRAVLSRVCLGDSWLRPGVGKLRAQAQSLVPKLTQIVRATSETQLIVEALEVNLPRILDGLAEYTTDEEIADLVEALLALAPRGEPAVRRAAAAAAGAACARRRPLVTWMLGQVAENLWPHPADGGAAVGWLGVAKSLFQQTSVASFSEDNLLTVLDYLELYALCISYLESPTATHNVLNAALECLGVLLAQATGEYRKALLERHPRVVDLDWRAARGHCRNMNPGSAAVPSPAPSPLQLDEPPTDAAELSFSGALHLGSLSQLTTPQLSVEDLTIQTPDSPTSETEMADEDPLKSEQLSKDLTEKLEEIGTESDSVDHHTVLTSSNFKLNIGTSSDDDIPLKYCARLLVSKFLLTGNKGDIHSDRSVRVSVKASALSCVSELLRLYPQAATAYLDRECDVTSHNASGASEDSTQDQLINDFILERNVCYQESFTDSLCQEYLNKGLETSQTISKRELEISQKTTKDIPSTIMDSHSTNVNMTVSNFTTNSNMSNSNDRMSSGYPMSSSGELLSNSLDLDMKFDHFGEATEEQKKPARREPKREVVERREVVEKREVEKRQVEVPVVESKEFVCQHTCDVFTLLEGHCDPQIRGLVRVCIGSYLEASLDLSHGDYSRWRPVASLPQEIGDEIAVEKLVQIVLKGLSDTIHSCVTHTLTALTRIVAALSKSPHASLVPVILNGLVAVETNSYWLCRVNLCKLYEKLPYERIFIICPGYRRRSAAIMNTLCRLLGDQDQKVRRAAGNTIASVIPKIYPSRSHTPSSMATELARRHSALFAFECPSRALDLVRDHFFYHDLPDQLKDQLKGGRVDCGSLRTVLADLMGKLMEASCKYYWQGLLETLQTVAKTWTPWCYKSAYTDQGMLDYCVDQLDCGDGSVAARTMMLDLCRLVYPVEVDASLGAAPPARADVPERAPDRWRHLPPGRASASERLQRVVLRLLNAVVHLAEDVSPAAMVNRILPGSPVRRNVSDSRRNSTEQDDKGVVKKKNLTIGNLRANFAGNFYAEPFYMKFYDHLRATYSNHKINLDPKSSMFHEFLSTLLDALAIQLELSTEKEFGHVTEELLYYLRVIMPLNQEKSVYCITQLLKCLFGTNMINQYQDFESVRTKPETKNSKPRFYEDVLLVNGIDTLPTGGKNCANSNVKLSLDVKNPSMMVERDYLINLENFARNRTDRKWSTNKKELERYIRLFEPVVIQALKSYTMQSDAPLQCRVLSLLSQLLTLRVNYCMLDSDLVFIGYLHKQLDLVEQNEIPNPCELVSNVMLFLVQLYSSKHHSKQIIDIPKLIQLCDSLLAAGYARLCARSLACLAAKVFSNQGATCSRSQLTQTCAHREVLFSMMLKTLHCRETINIIRAVLALSQDQPESYIRWSQLAADALLIALSNRDVELDDPGDVAALEALIDAIYRDELLEQSRVEAMMKILFKAPVDQAAPLKEKTAYLAIIMILLRKLLPLVPENEALLTINYLKSTLISPQSIFFNVKPDIDPLNVLNRNENCANLPPDVVLVRFLFKTLTLAVIEIDSCHDFDCASPEAAARGAAERCRRFLYSVCVGLVCHVKHMLHLTEGCPYPLTARTAHSLLTNELGGLNTGLYSPEENIPLELLDLVCLRAAHRMPLLVVHWTHLVVRLHLLEHKCSQQLLGVHRAAVSARAAGPAHCPRRTGVALALSEHFLSNGVQSAVHLSWLVVSGIRTLVASARETPVARLLRPLHEEPASSMLLLRAVAARGVEEQYTLNTLYVLSQCHASQSGALVLLVCRALGKLEPALAIKFVKLAIARCRSLQELPVEEIQAQITKEDVQAAFELLQRDKAHLRYRQLVLELNTLAAAAFDLSPLDLSQDRRVQVDYVAGTLVDDAWLGRLVAQRCCRTVTASKQSPEKLHELALQLSNMTYDSLMTAFSCQEFDRRILGSCFKVSCHSYLREFINIIAVYESKETEKDRLIEQREQQSYKDVHVDSNRLSNTLQVFKKSDNKECKSQFFIPITDSNDKLGSLHLSEEPSEIVPPKLPDLYLSAVIAFDKSLTDVLRLFPKQSRPLSQSENFNLNVEHSLDRYTRRCHQVFQDKLFNQEFSALHTILKGFLSSLESILDFFNDIDCDVLEKCQEDILPTTLAKNVAIFSVISLQYLSFLIKNKSIVESPVSTEVPFRSDTSGDKVVIDNVIETTLKNLSKALDFKDIWKELNTDKNTNRLLSAISCFYAIVKYFVKDTKPIKLKSYLRTSDEGPKCDIVLVCDKLATLIEYWEDTVYKMGHFTDTGIIGDGNRQSVERLIVSLSRLHIVSNVPLIPPMAWPEIDVVCAKDDAFKVDLPLQALQDADVLQSFLFRINLISWSSKKQFEEVWVALLNGLQGSGCHWSVRGISQSLATAAGGHVPRRYPKALTRMSRLKQILVGTSAYRPQAECVNLERAARARDGCTHYQYGQFSADYLKLAAEITDHAPFKVRQQLKRMRRSQEIDINSCVQLVIDVATQMLHPKAPTGLAARGALLEALSAACELAPDAGSWCALAHQVCAEAATGAPAQRAPSILRALSLCLALLYGFEGLTQELSTVYQKLIRSITSNSALLRQAAIQGCLLQIYSPPKLVTRPDKVQAGNTYQELIAKLNVTVRQHLAASNKISLYEQSLYWTVLFALVELGQADLMHLAAGFLLERPRHYAADTVVKGITSVIRQQVLPKDLKKTIIEKLMDNMSRYSEPHVVQIVMVHLFTADDKLLSPKLASDVSNMDPDILMTSMERVTLLYRVLRGARRGETRLVAGRALKYFLRETLPPAATLSRVVIEFVESVKVTEKAACGVLSERARHVDCSLICAEIVFEVFETAVSQDQLPVLSGWIFEALCHLLGGKISHDFLPYCLNFLLISASFNPCVRRLAPLALQILRDGYENCAPSMSEGIFLEKIEEKMSFSDKKLLCTVAMHSDFTDGQLDRLRELCEGNDSLKDLRRCLVRAKEECN